LEDQDVPDYWVPFGLTVAVGWEYVEKGDRPKQWAKTAKGRWLDHEWQPPRRFQPAIERDDEESPTNEGLQEVTCAILRGSEDDDGEVFEEARCDVGFFAHYEGDQLVEIGVAQPDDYDDPDTSAVIALKGASGWRGQIGGDPRVPQDSQDRPRQRSPVPHGLGDRRRVTR
jgi:hypothetical protein